MKTHFQILPAALKLLFLLAFYAGSVAAEDLTLRFQQAESELSTSRIYEVSEIAGRTDVNFPRGMVRPSVLNVENSNYYEFEAPMENADFLMSSSSPIFSEFKRTFIDPLDTAISQMTSEVESIKLDSISSQTVQSAGIKTAPMRFSLGVTDNKVMVEVDGIEFFTKVRAKISNDVYKLLCGSSVTLKLTGDIVVRGEMDIDTGVFDLTKVSANEKSSTECSGLLGKVLDVFIEFFVDSKLESTVEDFIAPVLAEFSSKQVGKSMQELIGDEIILAANILGVDILSEATEAINKNLGGINLDFLVGFDYFGEGEHMLGFSAYQDLIEADIYNEGSAWSNRTYTKFSCPGWASQMKVYESTAVEIGSRSAGRGSVPIYGLQFTVAYSGAPSTYTKLMEVRQRGQVASRKPVAVLGTCRSKNGLWSRLRPIVYLPK